MLKIVIVPIFVVMDAATISWEFTAICFQELVSKHLLKNVAAHVFLGLLQWVEGSRGTISGWPVYYLENLCTVHEE